MRRLSRIRLHALVSVVVGLLLPSAAPSAAQPRELGGTTWRLVEFQSTDSTTTRPDDPNKYTMHLNADGTVAMRLDCNRATGKWSATVGGEAGAGRFEFSPLAGTKAFCPPPSMDDRILRQTSNVRSYLLKNGKLHLSLMAGGGIMVWEPVTQVDPQKEARLAWFRDAKYGLFIHWGLYAIPAGEWKGERVPGIGEWIMNRAKIPVAEYEKLAAQFNPLKFDADAWVQLAHDAGMKYIVITSKHHDGFALFKSAASTFNIVDATPFKRDVIKELAAACAKRNMRLGFYYSQAQDWHEPNGAGNSWDFVPNAQKDFDQYLRDKAEPQIREILTNYGPVALVWFDTPQLMTAERGQRLTNLVRTLQPKTLIDGRLGTEGDYVTTADNVIPGDRLTQAWETPATINHTWGYRKDDVDWKRPGEIIFKLIDIVSKGGNYLLNVGPMADGVIPQASQDVLREAGRWLKLNGEAVYGAQATPFGDELGEPSAKGTKDVRGEPLFLVRTDYRVTAKPGKLYFTFFVEPRVPFALPTMKNAVKRAYFLANGKPLDLVEKDGVRTFTVPRPMLDPLGTVIVVEFEGDTVTR